MNKNADDTELRIVLDGECGVRATGYDCVGAKRVLFVPFNRTRCPVEALLVCRQQGLLAEKLDKLSPDDAWALYWMTLPTQEPQN
jgi:hypothetical protein